MLTFLLFLLVALLVLAFASVLLEGIAGAVLIVMLGVAHAVTRAGASLAAVWRWHVIRFAWAHRTDQSARRSLRWTGHLLRVASRWLIVALGLVVLPVGLLWTHHPFFAAVPLVATVALLIKRHYHDTRRP